ncbi:MAG: GDP-mannose 4,6-dehydratase [Gemmatimonadetes bacterium]|mgnify:CR=1 FL=1|nr:GDP-mannose 4,6-dehydratase [Gemmatimonadota bacterium]|tara:strand:- start:4879 stop:5886 length:1008 start_codon:yes stop_codon:yes gene_type:complete
MSKGVALITGITGQDGSYLAEFLLEKGYQVVGLVRRSTHYGHPNIDHLTGRVTLEYGDLIDPDFIDSVMAKHRPDEIYHLAAQSVPADSWQQPIVTAEITAIAPVRMMEAVRRHVPDSRFYQATSREIFGGLEEPVLDESSPLRANNPYGVAKLYAHLMVDTYRQSYGLFACGGILFNHESPRRSLHFITRKVTMAVVCIKLGIQNPPLNEIGEPLVSDGKLRLGDLDSVRDWGYAKEYVEAMWMMLQQDAPQNYVIATNTSHSIRELCEVAFSHAGLNWNDHVVSDDAFRRPTEIAESRGDFSKARTELGWKPRTYFEDLIKLMVDADLENLST